MQGSGCQAGAAGTMCLRICDSYGTYGEPETFNNQPETFAGSCSGTVAVHQPVGYGPIQDLALKLYKTSEI